MSEILDLAEARERVLRWTVDEYEHLVESGAIRKSAELVRGIIVERMSKSPLHRALAKWIYDRLQIQLPAGYVAFLESPLRLADSEPEPDVSVVRGLEADFRRRHPTRAELVVEVAVSSAVLDRESAGLYAEAGVREYWIVLAGERSVEVYCDPVGGVYQRKRLYCDDEMLICEATPDLTLSLPEMFAE